MPKRAMQARGKVVADLVIFIIRNVALNILNTKRYTSSSGSVLVLFGIWIGEAEGRPMTAAKLAEYIGMPRATVIRKINELKQRGFVADGDGHLFTRIDDPAFAALVSENISLNVKHIHSAARKLSKLDT